MRKKGGTESTVQSQTGLWDPGYKICLSDSTVFEDESLFLDVTAVERNQICQTSQAGDHAHFQEKEVM